MRLAESLAVFLGRRQRPGRRQRMGGLVMPARPDVLAFAGAPAVERASPTPPRLRECPDCGAFQVVPSLRAGATARCLRCGAVLRRAHHDPLGRALALHVAALAMLGVAGLMSLMTVSTGGMDLSADLFSGPKGLQRHGLWELALVVLFTTAVAPFVRFAAMTYVLGGLRLRRPPPHLRRLFAWLEQLRPWSMVEVYLLGVFVAYVKLVDLVHIEIGPALYALGALMLTTVVADAVLDRQAVWEEMEARGLPGEAVDHAARSPRQAGGRGRRLRDLRAGLPARRGRRAALPALRLAPACAQAEQHRADLGVGDRLPGALRAGERLSRPHRGPARRRRSQHHPRRGGGAPLQRHVPACGAGLLRQRRRPHAQADRPGRHAGRHPGRLGGAAARPDFPLPLRPGDRPLVDDRRLHDLHTRGAGAVRGGGHHRSRRWRGGLRRGRHPDHVRGRGLRSAADVGRGGGERRVAA